MSGALRKCSGDPILAQFLAALTDPQRPDIDAQNIAVVVAHPDDETIGCGAQLARWKRATVIVVTDGAPRNISSTNLVRFGSRDRYASARTHELLQALSIAGVAEANVVQLSIPDQEAAFRLADLAIRLADILAARRIEIAITHAYEGGHPDHDATAFAVHAAAKQLEKSEQALSVLEMPFYRAGDTGWLLQSFISWPRACKTVLVLSAEERAKKRAMLSAHLSQQEMLAHFSTSAEYFRVAPTYNFAAPPNDRRLFYEQHDWGIDGKKWCQLARAALCELDSGAAE